MKSIYKYQLSLNDVDVILLPVGSDILTIQMQDNNICMWALVDTSEQRMVSRHIYTFGMGHSIDPTLKLKHISTYQIGSYLVYHAFELI
jgi:hypothetical protein